MVYPPAVAQHAVKQLPVDEEVRDALVAQARDRAAPPPSRFEGVDPRRVPNPSAMVRRRNLLTRLLSFLAFRKVAFNDRHVRAIRDLSREGDVVYVMNHHSVLDYLFFNYAFLRFGLPLVYFANNLSMTPFRPLWRLAVEGGRRLFGWYKHRLAPSDRLALGLERGLPALLFLRKKTIWPWVTDRPDNTFLERALVSQVERLRAVDSDGDRARPIRIVPQLLVWTHNPKRHRKSFWHTVFGNPEAPGRFRKLVNFLANRRRAFVQVGKTIDLRQFVEAEGPDLPTAELAERLRFAINHAMSLEERVIKGPVLKRSKDIREEILASEAIEARIAEVAAATNLSAKAVKKEIRGYLKEIGADFSMRYVEMMCMVMTVIFNRLYSEVVNDLEGLEPVRAAGRRAPLVLLPCHRSHVDYLVISYLFYSNGLIPPHIAAGKNLNFFPMGHILRRSGAFYLRRSFRGNKAYSLAFREYMRKLVAEGYWLEFFLEGGRSRTGKMLPPKFGLLKMVVEAIRSGAAPDVYFVPIYVGYEHVIEEGAFSRELRGGKKKKENITSLLNATSVLWQKHGRLYVNYGEPISCRATLDACGLADADPDTEALDAYLHRLGYLVSTGINDVAMVTPASLAAMALLLHDKRGIPRDQLLARVGFLLDLANEKAARLSRTLQHALKIHRQEIVAARERLAASPDAERRLALGEGSDVAHALGHAVSDAIGEVMANWTKAKTVESHAFADDDVVWALAAEHRIGIDFYKNNIIHLFVPEAIMATAVRTTLDVTGTTTLARVTEAAAFLARTFKREFVFDPDRGYAPLFGDTLARFDEGGLIERAPGETFADVKITIAKRGADTMALFHRVLLPWIEAYWLLATQLEQGDEAVNDKELLKEAQRIGQRRYHVGDLTCPEASSSVNFGHALNAFEEFGFVVRTRKGRDRLARAWADSETPAEGKQRLRELADKLRTYFA